MPTKLPAKFTNAGPEPSVGIGDKELAFEITAQVFYIALEKIAQHEGIDLLEGQP